MSPSPPSPPSPSDPQDLADPLGELQYGNASAEHPSEDMEAMPTGIISLCKMKPELNESLVLPNST